MRGKGDGEDGGENEREGDVGERFGKRLERYFQRMKDPKKLYHFSTHT